MFLGPDVLLTAAFQILTKDSVTVFVNAIMYYKVKDATSAVANVDDYNGSAQLLAATTLRWNYLSQLSTSYYLLKDKSFTFFIIRNVLGTKNLGDILSERESIALEMQVVHCPITMCYFFRTIGTAFPQYLQNNVFSHCLLF